jgi:hypothetical protein
MSTYELVADLSPEDAAKFNSAKAQVEAKTFSPQIVGNDIIDLLDKLGIDWRPLVLNFGIPLVRSYIIPEFQKKSPLLAAFVSYLVDLFEAKLREPEPTPTP